MPPGGGSGMGMGRPGMRSFRQDRSVLHHRVKKGTARRMLTFAVPYKRILAIFLPIVVLDAVVGAVNPLIFRAIIDKGIAGHDKQLIIGLAVLAAALAIVDAVLSLFERRTSAVVGEGLIYDMRSKVFRHIQRMPLAFFTRTQTGALVSRLNNDVIGAQQAFTDMLSNIVGNLVTVVIVLVAMFILSWQITLVALVLLPLFLIPARMVGRRLGAMTKESYDLNAEMNMVMQERFNVSGAMLVKLFGHASDEATSFDDKAARVRDIGVAQALYARLFLVALTLTAALATAFAYGFGGLEAVNGTLAVGTVVAITAYLTRLYAPLTQLSNLNLDVATALVSFERVFEVLDLVPMIEEAPDAVAIAPGPAAVEFDHVSFSYPTADEVSLASLEAVATLEQAPRAEVLHDVSFTVEPGQLVALVGPSGAGKSTISSLVPRLYDASAGTVRIHGVDLRQATFDSIQDTVGVVTQDPHLFHDTLRANLRYAKPEATDEEVWDALDQAQILPLIDALPDGLDTVVGERGYRLSGGEKQRVALARLILKAPQVVVLDEATAHLDSESESAVQRALATALAGRTSLVIAHRLSTVRQADQLLVIDAGRIVERGTHAELLAEGGLYAELYRTQFAEQDQFAETTGTRTGSPRTGSDGTGSPTRTRRSSPRAEGPAPGSTVPVLSQDRDPAATPPGPSTTTRGTDEVRTAAQATRPRLGRLRPGGPGRRDGRLRVGVAARAPRPADRPAADLPLLLERLRPDRLDDPRVRPLGGPRLGGRRHLDHPPGHRGVHPPAPPPPGHRPGGDDPRPGVPGPGDPGHRRGLVGRGVRRRRPVVPRPGQPDRRDDRRPAPPLDRAGRRVPRDPLRVRRRGLRAQAGPVAPPDRGRRDQRSGAAAGRTPG